MSAEMRRRAHRWVAGVIEGALSNSSGDYDLDEPEFLAAIKRLRDQHYAKGAPPAAGEET